MSRPMDPFSGAYSMSADNCIPSWEKGQKLPHWDSSDLSGISSSSEEDNSSFEISFTAGDAASYVSDSDDGDNGTGPAQFASPNAQGEVGEWSERTPRAARKHLHRPSISSQNPKSSEHDAKGKCKAKNQDEELSPRAVQQQLASGASHGRQQHQHNASAGPSGSRTRMRRPRSHSNASTTASSPPYLSALTPPASATSPDSAFRSTSKRAPGPAAQAMADFMSASSKPAPSQAHHADPLLNGNLAAAPSAASFSSSQSKLGARPLSRPLHLINSNRSLGRAASAPNNLFAESVPTNNLFSPGGSRLVGAGAIIESLTPSSSPEADMQTILNKAYEARSGTIDFSHKNLARIAANVADLSHYVTWDARTRSSRPTPIYLNFDNNYLNAAGLPSSLFSITNLEILSLRANQIESLPQSIGNLTGLKQLLLFNNKLTYLPAEILELKLEKLVLGSNRFPAYVKPESEKVNPASQQVGDKNKEEGTKATKKRVCEPRKRSFQVPSLLELCTRRLLEPIEGSRDSASPAVGMKSKLFTPGMSNASAGTIRRNFHTVKDEIYHATIAPHLLQPFLPLLHPLPPKLRCLLTPSQSPSTVPEASIRVLGTPSSAPLTRVPGTPSQQSISTPFEAIKDIPQCSVCKTPCSEFAETRIEWRSEIAGVLLGKADDERCWIPVLWRGCSANCLDFLDDLSE